MITLIEILLAILFVVCVGLFILHKYNSEEISELKKEIRSLNAEITKINSKQRITEIKLMNISDASDKIEIVHKYDDTGAPKIGGF